MVVVGEQPSSSEKKRFRSCFIIQQERVFGVDASHLPLSLSLSSLLCERRGGLTEQWPKGCVLFVVSLFLCVSLFFCPFFFFGEGFEGEKAPSVYRHRP